jgi:predicted dehydrogenase
MKFALLGADPETLALVRAVHAQGSHQLVWFCSPQESWQALAPYTSNLRPTTAWEGLLGGTIADAVIVGRNGRPEEQAEQLIRLVQAGIPLLASLPIGAPLLSYFEIDSLRGDPPLAVVPALAGRWHPAIKRLAELTRHSQGPTIGPLEQLVIERFLPERSRLSVLAQFAADVDLAQTLTGDLTHLGAMAPGATGNEDKPQFNNLGVQSYGPKGVMLRWSVGPIETKAGARISLLGADGKAVLEAPAGGSDGSPAWRLEIRPRDPRTGEPQQTPIVEEFAAWDPGPWLLEHFVQLVERKGADAASPLVTGPTWADATRAAELAEAIDRSLARRRTIEVRVDRETESSAFKGTMSAVGCTLLLMSLPMFVVGVILGNKPFGFVLAGKLIVYASLALLVVFLLLQALGAIVPRSDAKRAEENPPAS